MIQTFENRFDPAYLALLSRMLDFEILKKTAIKVEREEKYKTYKPSRKKEVQLERAIKIDFCGFSGTTLLSAISKEQRDDIKAVYPKDYKRIRDLREEIHRKFEDLLTEKRLKDLNDSGIFLQIRFCFPYLYSDFAICLMRAEDSNIWDARMDHLVSFSKNAPMTIEEWKGSYLYRSQEASLQEIGCLCEKYPAFARTKEYDTARNTLEIRFAVIPMPICVLIINDTAIADSYIYAKVIKGNHLAVSTPVNIVSRYVDEKRLDSLKKEKKLDRTYEMWRQNFLYIWRHDLTMYADMCTQFETANPAGLATLRPPIAPGPGNKSGIDWQKKIQRIINKRKHLYEGRDDPSTGGRYNPNSGKEKDNIETWKTNVIEKMDLSTRKIRLNAVGLDVSDLYIYISGGAKCSVKISCHGETIFYMMKPALSIAFCAIAHFAFSVKYGGKPVMHNYVYKDKTKLRKVVKSWLEAGNRIKNPQYTPVSLLKALFGSDGGTSWRFLIPGDNIEFVGLKPISDAFYRCESGSKRRCFQGIKPTAHLDKLKKEKIEFDT